MEDEKEELEHRGVPAAWSSRTKMIVHFTNLVLNKGQIPNTGTHYTRAPNFEKSERSISLAAFPLRFYLKIRGVSANWLKIV